MKENEAIRYFVDEQNYITGWQLESKKKHPELIENPAPIEGMMPLEFDSKNRIYNNGKLFKLENNQIFEEDYIDNGIIAFRKKWSIEKIVFAMLKGMENNNDPEYVELQTDRKNI